MKLIFFIYVSLNNRFQFQFIFSSNWLLSGTLFVQSVLRINLFSLEALKSLENHAWNVSRHGLNHRCRHFSRTCRLWKPPWKGFPAFIKQLRVKTLMISLNKNTIHNFDFNLILFSERFLNFLLLIRSSWSDKVWIRERRKIYF